MATVREERSIADLLKELRAESSTLLRQEVDLAKTEMSEKATRVGHRMGELAMGGAVAYLGALALLAAVVYGLASLFAQFMSADVAIWLAPLLVGAVLAGIGYGMLKKALDRLRQESLTPRKTTQSLREDKEWLKSRLP